MLGWEIAGWGFAVLVWLVLTLILLGTARRVLLRWQIRQEIEADRRRRDELFKQATGKAWEEATLQERIDWGVHETIKNLEDAVRPKGPIQ